MVYTSDSLALAALELFVHIGPTDEAPDDLIAIQAEVPVDLNTDLLAAKKTPKDWGFRSELTQRSGDAWSKSQQSLAIRVPSVLVDVEWNILINPQHEKMQQLKIVQSRPFRFDPRMFAASSRY